MLNTIQKDKLRGIKIFESIWHKKSNGEDDLKNSIPSFEELKKQIITEIENLGFTVTFPKNENYACNCIIRTFQKVDYEEAKSIIAIYGAAVFLPRARQWLSFDINDKKFKIDHENCIFRMQIFQDEYIDFDCDFEDFYVKVS